MAIKDFIIRGVFQDGITAALNGMVGGMHKVTAAAKTASAAMASMGTSVVRSMNAATAAINKQSAAWAANRKASQLASAAQTGLMVGGRGQYRSPRRIRTRSSFTPFQQSLAALGGQGYALGRGGTGVVLPLGSAMLAWKGSKDYMKYEAALTEVRKAANFATKREMLLFGNDLQQIGLKYGVGGTEMANIAAEIALGGVSNKTSIAELSGEAARASLLWKDGQPQDIANVMARVASNFYAGAPPVELQNRMRSFIDTIDYFEDKLPTNSQDILKGFFRFMSSGMKAGMTPEQIVSQVATMTSLGEPSGERAGSRLRTNWSRLSSIAEGRLKAGKLDRAGINTKELSNDLLTNSQLGIYKMLSQVLGREYNRAIKKGIKDPEIARKKAIRAAGQFLEDALGHESAGNLAPLLSTFNESILQSAMTNQGLARWALKQKDFIEYLDSLGDVGRRAARILEAYAAQADTTLPAGVISTNVEANISAMQERMQTSVNKLNAAFEIFTTKLGERLSGPVSSGLDKITEQLLNAAGVLDNVNYGTPEKRGGRGYNNPKSILRPFVLTQDENGNWVWVAENPGAGTPSGTAMGPGGTGFPLPKGNILESGTVGGWRVDAHGFYTRDPLPGGDGPPAKMSFVDQINALQRLAQGIILNKVLGGVWGTLKTVADGPGALPGTPAPGMYKPPISGGILGHLETSGPAVRATAPPAIEVPLSVNVVNGGEVKITATVTKYPSVAIMPSGAHINTGSQSDPGPAGTAAAP